MSGNLHDSRYNLFLLVFLLMSIVILPFSCTGENKSKRLLTIGLVTNNRNGLKNIQGFRDGMTELGYREGQTVNYLFYEHPVTGIDLDTRLETLVKAKADLIFTAGTPTGVAAHRITSGTEIPVIFGVIADPIAAGVMNDLTHPGGNMTGVKLGDYQTRRLQFLSEMAPGIKRILVPYNAEDTASTSAVRQIENIAQSLGLELVERTAKNDRAVHDILSSIKGSVDAIFLVPGTTVNAHLKRVLAVALEQKLPVSGPSLAQVEEGALITYGFNHYEVGRQAARIADQVLKGADPGELPVETAEFFLAVNLEAAKMIDLQIPYAILQQADIIIRPEKK